MEIDLNKAFLDFTKGNTQLGDLEILYKFSQHRKNIVEIGTAYGIGSLILLSGSEGIVTTIDNHKYYRPYYENEHHQITPDEKWKIINNYLQLFSNNRIKVIKNDSVKEAENWKNESIDLLYIDGDHSYSQVLMDYRTWLSKVKKDGVILLHDIDKPGIKKLWRKIISNDITKNLVKELIQKTTYTNIIKVLVKL